MLTPGIEAVSFAMPARVKFRQGGDVFFEDESWIEGSAQCCRWLCAFLGWQLVEMFQSVSSAATSLEGAGGCDETFPSAHCWSSLFSGESSYFRVRRGRICTR